MTSIRYIAVIANTFSEGIQLIEQKHSSLEISEIRYQSGYIRLKTGTIYQVITKVGQAQVYEFVDYIKHPNWVSIEDEVISRVRK